MRVTSRWSQVQSTEHFINIQDDSLNDSWGIGLVQLIRKESSLSGP